MLPLYLNGELMRNIKIICRGPNSPSGKRTNVEFYVSEGELKEYKECNFGIEILEEPEKSKPKKKASKKSAK
jgi:hypothetical protein|tara:strand:- start:13 stop:228 length:216 start_codon:yes stop_codon:yes gene_type:complete